MARGSDVELLLKAWHGILFQLLKAGAFTQIEVLQGFSLLLNMPVAWRQGLPGFHTPLGFWSPAILDRRCVFLGFFNYAF